MRNFAEIERAVRDTLRADFGAVKIIDVKIHETVDYDDDVILRIDVIFEGTPKDLDARKLSGASRDLRRRLSDMKESAMPLLSFISGSDWNRNKRATA